MSKADRDREKIIARVKACLELSKDGSYQGEADAAMEAAKRLMAKHDLSMSDIELFKSPDNSIKEVEIADYTIRDRWDYSLVVAVSTLCSVIAHRNHGQIKGKRFAHISFIGYKKDVLLAEEIYRALRPEIVMLGIAYSKQHRKRYSYRLGLSDALVRRAQKEVELPEEQQARYGAIVVAKEKNIDLWAKKNSPTTGQHKDRGGARMDWNAYEDGREDGKDISLKNKKEIPGQ